MTSIFESIFGVPAGGNGKLTAVEDLAKETCCNCGVIFAMPADLQKNLIETGRLFYCPNGHPQHYTESEVSKLEKRLKQEKAFRAAAEKDLQSEREWSKRQARSRSALRGVVTRLKNKIADGKCPCCDQYFSDLHNHMVHDHPEYLEQTEDGMDLRFVPGEEVPAESTEAASEPQRRGRRKGGQ